MSDKPIIFSAESIAAIQRGDKTQTRRVINPQPYSQPIHAPELHRWRTKWHPYWIPKPKPPIVGDRLWVRERWQLHGWNFSNEVVIRYADSATKECALPEYRGGKYGTLETWDDWLIAETDKFFEQHGERPADNELGFEIAIPDDMPLRSPMFMPKWATRIWLEVTDVCAEKLQDIRGNITDIQSEGYTSTRSFSAAWNELNAKRGYSWQDNPWVWVYTFRLST